MIYSPRALPKAAGRGQCTRGINHITTSWRLINGLSLHWRGFLKGWKIHRRKMPLLFIFLLFFNTPCWNWWDSQISRLFNHVSCISNKLFVLFVVNAWNRLAMLGDSESGLFITQSSFSGIKQQVVTLRVCASRWTEVCGFIGSWGKKQTKMAGVLKIIIIFVIFSLSVECRKDKLKFYQSCTYRSV